MGVPGRNSGQFLARSTHDSQTPLQQDQHLVTGFSAGVDMFPARKVAKLTDPQQSLYIGGAEVTEDFDFLNHLDETVLLLVHVSEISLGERSN
tara:strand:+ start:1646 stop:1924 length:279 start_codon:yes stop_codon:yes gene_type:complete